MPLLILDSVSIAFGHKLLLDKVDLTIEPGERISLIGRNGEGKSTLLKLISGTIFPDDGKVIIPSVVNLSCLEQEVVCDDDTSVYDEVISGIGGVSILMHDYHQLTQKDNLSDKDLSKLETIQHQLEAKDGWNLNNKVDTVLTKLGLDPDVKLSELSGGWLRRAYLAKALISEPDLLLLDEPTNHLDIQAIQWLEELLLDFKGSILFITHDRALLQKLATRILELDRGNLTSWPGDYQNFLRRKDEQLNAEKLQNDRFDKKLSQEEVWIRKGIKARRTRNEGRVRALEEMRRQYGQRRQQQGKADFLIENSEISGKIVIEAQGVSFNWKNDEKIIEDFSIKVLRGDKLALIGPNGCGKTTFINLLLKKISPSKGTVKHGTKLDIAYFDQLRAQLDLEKTVAENVANGSDFVEIGGKSKHIMGYLGDFLFPPERARSPVKALSGGECNRLLLAKLFSKSSNFLILDEPTNDLDIESLELLEEILSEFKGTVILVSHDRNFLDNVVTSSFVFEGDGKIVGYSGGYKDAMKCRESIMNSTNFQEKQVDKTYGVSTADKSTIDCNVVTKNKAVKLGYMEQRELDSLPDKMEQLELDVGKLQQTSFEPSFYKGDKDEIASILNSLESKQKELDIMFERWEELESRSK